MPEGTQVYKYKFLKKGVGTPTKEGFKITVKFRLPQWKPCCDQGCSHGGVKNPALAGIPTSFKVNPNQTGFRHTREFINIKCLFSKKEVASAASFILPCVLYPVQRIASPTWCDD